MIFKAIDAKDDWVCVKYSATWRYGYDFMLDAAQVILNDFKDNVQRAAVYECMGGKPRELLESVKAHGGVLAECGEFAEECAAVAVAGISGIMECPIQITFYNQTNVVQLDCPVKKIFEEHGERVFDNYMNSVEIKAYCADTERRTVKRLNKE